MSDQATAQAWLEKETAQRYHQFTEKTTMYQELSQMMVQLADLEAGMRVLDLGCGTGITTQAILEAIKHQGDIYALDISEPMLNIARKQIVSKRVIFIQAGATQFAAHIAEPVDRILCNSLFWQFRNKPQVMAELKQILKPAGRFIFNAPEPYFIFKHIPRSRKVHILFDQLAAERYGVGRQDLRTMKLFLRNHGFELLSTQPLERLRSAEESYHFMQIPTATAWMNPPLSYETRMELLAEARQNTRSDYQRKQRWMYFITQPLTS